MYEAKKANVEAARQRFERKIANRSPELRLAADEYMEALTDFVKTFNDGPGADPRLMGLDTTGELDRMSEHAAWAEEERRRVRALVRELP